MHIYAIGDLHLSGEPASKPMEVFGEHWRNHKEKVAANWQNTVTAQDTVIVCGDISWAMTLEEAAQDLDWLAQLPGRKLLLRGNHDYWWSSLSKMQQRYGAHFEFLQNDCIMAEDIAVCGTRGWLLASVTPTEKFTIARESAWSFPCSRHIKCRRSRSLRLFTIRRSLHARSTPALLILCCGTACSTVSTATFTVKTTFLFLKDCAKESTISWFPAIRKASGFTR